MKPVAGVTGRKASAREFSCELKDSPTDGLLFFFCVCLHRALLYSLKSLLQHFLGKASPLVFVISVHGLEKIL